MLTKAIDILDTAKQNGIDILLNGEQLQLKLPKNREVDKSFLEEIRNNKALLIDFIKNHRETDSDYKKITKADRTAFTRLPLSFSQERLWFIDRLEGTVQYHRPDVLRLKGKLDREALENSLQEIVNRHEVLRTVLRAEEEVPYQFVKEVDGWNLNFIGKDQYKEEGLYTHINGLVKKPFDLTTDYMIRGDLIEVSDDEHVLVLTLHHIASDGWSRSVFVKEFISLYQSFSTGTAIQLPPLPLQFADYALWQRQYLQGEVFENKLSYWKGKLEGVSPLQLPTDYPRPSVQGTKGSSAYFTISKEVSEGLQQLSRQYGTTSFMTLLSAFKVLLYRYSGQDDICVGTPIAGRLQQEVEHLIGFFVNTLALRSTVRGEASFADLLQQVRATTLEAYEHQEVPFEKVVEAVSRQRDMSRNPLFQVMLVLQNTPEVPQLQLGELLLSQEELIHDTAKFDITFFINETPQGLQGAIEYSTDLYSSSTIERMVGHFEELLRSIVKDPKQSIGRLSLLSASEVKELESFNATSVEYPRDKTIADLFEEQARKSPESVAVVFEGSEWSYRELDERSNRIAHHLRSLGVVEETLVPVCIERSGLMIAAILGILKAGGAYVPIDPEYPKERISYMLSDSEARVVVSSKGVRDRLPSSGGFTVMELSEDWFVMNSHPVTKLAVQGAPHHLAYVIYTSGSTGKPKGVMMHNTALVNLLTWQEKQFSTEPRRVLQYASLNFDVSFQEIFSTLCFGNVLVLINAERRIDIIEVVKDIRQNKITHLFIPFIVLKNLAEYVVTLPKEDLPIKEIMTAGEQVKLTDDIKKLLQDYNITLVNQYGPTESHVVSHYRIDPHSELATLPPIGVPIDNTTLYILNEWGEQAPVGIPGELYIGGVQVAKGYINNPELTASKFVADKFSKDEGQSLYRTGDLTRWLTDGNIEYLGRRDDQVKIRGFRIELGEIESVLQQCPLVRQAVVLAKENKSGTKQLVGYVVPEGEFVKEDLVAYLEEALPKFMIPTLWVEMEKLPVTENGKIDRKALPEPVVAATKSSRQVAPKTEAEKILQEIWQELLKIQEVDVEDNFFELGGHSMMVLQLVNRVRKLGVEINPKDLFKYQTIEQQSKFINTSLKLLNAASGGEYVIPIQPEGNNIPLFAFSEFLLYSKVGEYISKDQPFYSIEPSPYEKPEEIAAHYIQEIKKVYPKGPYCLAGFCRWGGIAVEMAQALVAQGEEVPLLILIEYYSPKALRSRMSPKFLGPKMKYFYNSLKEKQSYLDKGKLVVEGIINVSEYVYDSVTGRYSKSRLGNKTYSGRVALVKASERYEFKENCNMGWSDNFIGEIENITIEGDHLNIMRNPAAAQLADKINKALEKVNNEYLLRTKMKNVNA